MREKKHTILEEFQGGLERKKWKQELRDTSYFAMLQEDFLLTLGQKNHSEIYIITVQAVPVLTVPYFEMDLIVI